MFERLVERARKGPKYRYKSSVDGRFVSKLYAMLHPSTTYRMTVR